MGGVGNISDPEGLVPQAVAAVHERIASEQGKQEEIHDSTRQEREFLPRMGAALLEDLHTPVDGDWLFPIAELGLKSHGKEILGKGVVQSNSLSSRLLRNYLRSNFDTANEPNCKTVYTFSGNVTGRVCRFAITTKTVHENSFLTDETGESIRGYVLFESHGTSGEVGEYKDGNLTTFYPIRRAVPMTTAVTP